MKTIFSNAFGFNYLIWGFFNALQLYPNASAMCQKTNF